VSQIDNLLRQNLEVYNVAFKIGITHSDNCINIACNRPLTDFEFKKQTPFSIRHYFCIKCRSQGIPKYGKIVDVKCVKCGTIKEIKRLGESLLCKDCLTLNIKKRAKEREIEKRLKLKHEVRTL